MCTGRAASVRGTVVFGSAARGQSSPMEQQRGHRTTRIAGVAAVVPGRVLQGVFGAVGLLRPAAKPLHPAGTLLPAVIQRFGLPETDRLGVPWLDDAGTSRAVVRFSRATGLPAALPDVHGLAVRIVDPGVPDADLLLATTGLGRWTRYVLRPSRSAEDVTYSTLLPYRTPTGPVALAATPDAHDPDRLFLAVARPRGPWSVVGDLRVDGSNPVGSGDESISFDPVLRQLAGLSYDEWVVRLREGAYRAARWSRARRG